MKKYVLILLMFAVPVIGQEKNTQTQMNFPYVNNSLKMYMTFGLPFGVGLLYAPEFRSSIHNNILHVINFDVKFVGFNIIPDSFFMFGFSASAQYSIGTLLASGGRFYVDLVGVGWNWSGYDQVIYITIQTPGFQNTLSNGFYWAVRTAVQLSRENRIRKLEAGFEGYLAIGYDFGKKINPKDYESRMK